MASSMQCDIVSAEKEIFSGRITKLLAVGTVSYTHLTLPTIYSV